MKHIPPLSSNLTFSTCGNADARACPIKRVFDPFRAATNRAAGSCIRIALFTLLLCNVVLASCAFVPMEAYAADEFPVRVGYFGGPYYDKAVYSLDDLARLEEDITGGTVVYEYSSMDKGGFLRKGFARGVPLRDILENAGIDASAIASFYFDTADGYKVDDEGNPVRQWSYDALLGTRRYYYPTMWEYYDAEDLEIPKKYRETVEQERVIVPTVIAIESSFARVGSGGEAVWNDSSIMSTKAGIRLMFGQTAATDSTAGYSAHSIEGLKVTFAGHPTIAVSQTDLSGEKGDEFEISYELQAVDEAISAAGTSAISWAVTDESVARVTDMGSGKLKVEIVGDGSTSLVASYGDAAYDGAASASIGVSGQSEGDEDPSEEDDPPKEGEPGDGEEGEGGSGDGGAEGADKDPASSASPGNGVDGSRGMANASAEVSALPGNSAVPIQLSPGAGGVVEVVEGAESGSSSNANVRELTQVAEQEMLLQEMVDYGFTAAFLLGVCVALAVMGLCGHLVWFARARKV